MIYEKCLIKSKRLLWLIKIIIKLLMICISIYIRNQNHLKSLFYLQTNIEPSNTAENDNKNRFKNVNH